MTNVLHDAALRGDIAKIAEAQNVWLLNNEQENVMHTAARGGQSEVLSYLFQHHPLMGIQQDAHGKTVLHSAVEQRQTDIIFQIMTLAPEWVQLVDASQNTPLQDAICLGYMEAVLIMVSKEPKSVQQVDSRQRTFLHLAANERSHTILQLLLVVCPVSFLRSQDETGHTPLNIAVWYGNLEAAKVLVTADPSALHIVADEGHTPALTAVDMGHNKILRYLIRTHPRIINQTNSQNGANLLHYATNLDTACALLKLKPDLLDGVMADGSSVLHMAIENEERVEFLLKSKPSLLLHRDNENKTALQWAYEYQKNKSVATMLRFKPDLIYTDNNKNNVLHIAVKCPDSAIIANVFANCVSNLYCENINGQTPLCLAVRKHNRMAVEIFQSHMTLEMAVPLRHLCFQNCGIDLQAICLQYCDVLQEFLLPSLANIVFEFFSITFPKKRKHE